jgi:hypothetical protein
MSVGVPLKSITVANTTRPASLIATVPSGEVTSSGTPVTAVRTVMVPSPLSTSRNTWCATAWRAGAWCGARARADRRRHGRGAPRRGDAGNDDCSAAPRAGRRRFLATRDLAPAQDVADPAARGVRPLHAAGGTRRGALRTLIATPATTGACQTPGGRSAPLPRSCPPTGRSADADRQALSIGWRPAVRLLTTPANTQGCGTGRPRPATSPDAPARRRGRRAGTGPARPP